MSCRSTIRTAPRPDRVTVVIVDDDPREIAAYTQALVIADFTVRLPGANADVLAVIGRQTAPVAVVMDATPRGPRAVLAQQLARLSPRPALIAVSGWPRGQLPHADVFDEYCLKPCSASTVVAAVREAVSRQ